MLAAFLLLTTLLVAPAGRVAAQPDDEGESPSLATLRANLAAAAAGYIEAENKLNASKRKQSELGKQLQDAELTMARARSGVGRYAGEAYKTGRLGVLDAILSATSPDEFLGRAAAIDRMVQRDQESIVQLLAAKRAAEAAKAAIDAEVAVQEAAAKEMARRKAAAEKALGRVSGGSSSSRVDVGAAPTARPAPRNADGSWPKESCSENDPTPASGCVTPRTLHALNEAKRVGFDWYVSCFRNGGSGEHPKGRACDFAAFPGGFVNRSAGGTNRVYGDRLAAFYIKNAKALGVMYVVWYCQIWHVGAGWRRYNSAGSNCGDAPAGDHTNHVHVSIY